MAEVKSEKLNYLWLVGYIFFSNPEMPELLKIGFTERDPSSRAKEISQDTGYHLNLLLIIRYTHLVLMNWNEKFMSFCMNID